VHARLDYAAVDDGLRDGGRFSPFDRVARALERARLAAGALVLLTADVDVRVGEDGEPVLERLEAESPSRRIVTEAMIAAGAFAARWARDAGVRLIHRTQVRPPGADGFAGRVVADPVEIRRIRMSLRRGETGVEPGEHFALGLPAYAQVTSPLRRYQDLANHRQIVAALRDEPAPYDEERLRRVAAATERVEIDGRRAERRANRYWRLRALQARVGEVLEGIVVDASHRPVVELPEIGLEEQVAGLEGTEAGRRVALRVARVEPRADILRLRPEV
jgi:exoribonuclease-2